MDDRRNILQFKMSLSAVVVCLLLGMIFQYWIAPDSFFNVLIAENTYSVLALIFVALVGAYVGFVAVKFPILKKGTVLSDTPDYLLEQANDPMLDIGELLTAELRTIPKDSALLKINIKEYYLSLYFALMRINKNEDEQSCPKNGPLAHYRIILLNNGLIEICKKKEHQIGYSPQEAKKIACAIYQFAYAYTLLPGNQEVLLLSRGIGFFLMRSFSLIHPSREVLAIRNEFRQLIYSFGIKQNRRDIVSPATIKENSALLIQRRFRTSCFIKKGSVIAPLGSELKTSMDQHLIPQQPLEQVLFPPLTKEQKDQWVKEAKPGCGDLAKKLAIHLVFYRSHKQFKGRLFAVITQFNNYLHSLPEADREYVLIVPELDRMASNHWVSGLALPFFAKKPISILYPGEIASFKKNHPELKFLVFLDDALYSGRQLEGLVLNGRHSDLKNILVLPFYSKRVDWLQRNGVICFLGERMLTPEDLECRSQRVQRPFWINQDSNQLNYKVAASWSYASNKIGTYFFHKVADSASTFFGEINQLHQNHQSLVPQSKSSIKNY